MTLRLAYFAFASAVAISAQVTPARTKASLEGRVISSTTGAPLAKAMVTLDAGNDKKYRTLSGKDGTFFFEDIEPNDYSVTIKRVGYLENELPELSVAPGERKKDVELKLTPQGVISGRVVDEDGDPVPQAQVVCYRSLGGREEADAESGFQRSGRGSQFHVHEFETRAVLPDGMGF